MNESGDVVYLNLRAKEVLSTLGLTLNELSKLLPNSFDDILKDCLHSGRMAYDVESSFADFTYLWSFSPFNEQKTLHC